MPLTAIAKTGRKAESHRPFPRAIVGADGWQLAVRELVEATATLLGLWGDKDAVHLALLEELSGAIAVFTLPCPDGKYPSVGAHHPAAIRLERTILDLYGHPVDDQLLGHRGSQPLRGRRIFTLPRSAWPCTGSERPGSGRPSQTRRAWARRRSCPL